MGWLTDVVPADEWERDNPCPTVGQIWHRQSLLRFAFDRAKGLALKPHLRERLMRAAAREYWALSRRVAAGEFKKRARQIVRERYFNRRLK